MIKKEKNKNKNKNNKGANRRNRNQAAKEGDENTRWKREGNGEERHKDNDKWGKKDGKINE